MRAELRLYLLSVLVLSGMSIVVHAQDTAATYHKYIVVQSSSAQESSGTAGLTVRSARTQAPLAAKDQLMQTLQSLRPQSDLSQIKIKKLAKWSSSEEAQSGAASSSLSLRQSRVISPSIASSSELNILKLDVQGHQDLIQALEADPHYLVEPDYEHRKLFSSSRDPEPEQSPLIPVEQPNTESPEPSPMDRLIQIISDIVNGPQPPVTPEPLPDPVVTPQPVPEPTPTPAPQPVPTDPPQVDPVPVPDPQPAPAPQDPAPTPTPAPAPAPVDVTPVWPTDRHVHSQWAVEAIHLPEAWALEDLGQVIVVAVIDDGIDLQQADLVNNIWTNPNEIAGNGIDDDNNGYIDDVHGWDFADDDNSPQADDFHGTHVSGIIAAETDNGLGVAGFSLHNKIKILPLKVFGDGSNYANTSDIIEAINYASQMGARVMNMSLGSLGYSWTYDQTVQQATRRGALIVAAAGNDNSAAVNYPAGFPDALSVASVNQQGDKSSFSNFGRTVDIQAPGDQILSTIPGDLVAEASGTSMATPMVAGLAGLILTQRPDMSRADLVQTLISSVDHVNSRQDIGAGQINAFQALQQAQSGESAPVSENDQSPRLTLLIQQTHPRWYIVHADSSTAVGVLRADMRASSYEVTISLASSGEVLSTQRVDTNVDGEIDVVDLRQALGALGYAGKYIVSVRVFYRGQDIEARTVVWYGVGSVNEDRLYDERVTASATHSVVESQPVESVQESVVTPVDNGASSQGYRRRATQNSTSRAIIVS